MSPPLEGRKAGKAAGRQTGLSAFYKSEICLLCPLPAVVNACLSAAHVVEGGFEQVQFDACVWQLCSRQQQQQVFSYPETLRHPHRHPVACQAVGMDACLIHPSCMVSRKAEALKQWHPANIPDTPP